NPEHRLSLPCLARNGNAPRSLARAPGSFYLKTNLLGQFLDINTRPAQIGAEGVVEGIARLNQPLDVIEGVERLLSLGRGGDIEQGAHDFRARLLGKIA